MCMWYLWSLCVRSMLCGARTLFRVNFVWLSFPPDAWPGPNGQIFVWRMKDYWIPRPPGWPVAAVALPLLMLHKMYSLYKNFMVGWLTLPVFFFFCFTTGYIKASWNLNLKRFQTFMNSPWNKMRVAISGTCGALVLHAELARVKNYECGTHVWTHNLWALRRQPP